jgi:hypothetical protein
VPEKNPLLRAALFYAQRLHWPVLPAKPRAKQPLTQHGSLDATTDEAQIRAWWKKWPTANVALRTGVFFWVLDVDPAHGGDQSLMRLVAAHGALRDTLMQKTGGGGSQRFYLQPEQAVIVGKAPLYDDYPGIDARGENNYVVVEPSIHPSGNRYTWDTVRQSILEEPPQPADPWLIEWVTQAANGAAPNGGRRQFHLPEKIPYGEQHKYLVSLAGKMRAAWMGYQEIVEALWEVNQKRCEKPGPREHIEQYARSVCNYTPGPAHQPAPVIDVPAVLAPPVREHAVASYDADCPEPTPLIEPILYPGLTILGGRPKMGKSWFALQLAIALVNQLKVGGYLAVPKKYRCLYVSLEDRKPQLKKRLRHLVPDASYLHGLDLQYELAPLLAGGAEQLDQSLTREPVDLLIVDSLLAAAQQAGRKNMDLMQNDYNLVRALRELAVKHSIALVLIAHTRKASGDFLDLIQGTSGTTAAADAVWVLQRTPDGKATLSVTGREVPNNVFGLVRAQSSAAWTITGEGDEVTQSDARQDILQLLRDKCRPARDRKTGKVKTSPGLSPSAIAKELHKPISSINRQLAALCELGLVLRTGYGNYNLPGEDEPPEAYE